MHAKPVEKGAVEVVKRKSRTATVQAYDESGPASSAYARRLADLKAASRLVGDTPASRLSWIARFVSEDSKAWPSGTRATHGDCILALTGFDFPQNFLGGVRLPPPLSPEDVNEVHRELKNVLEDLVNSPVGRPVFLPAGAVSVGLVRLTKANQKPALWGSVARYSSPLALLHVLRDLVLTVGDRLIACQLCGAPFVAIKKQQFCNTTCAQKFRNEKKAGRARTLRRRS